MTQTASIAKTKHDTEEDLEIARAYLAGMASRLNAAALELAPDHEDDHVFAFSYAA